MNMQNSGVSGHFSDSMVAQPATEKAVHVEVNELASVVSQLSDLVAVLESRLAPVSRTCGVCVGQSPVSPAETVPLALRIRAIRESATESFYRINAAIDLLEI